MARILLSLFALAVGIDVAVTPLMTHNVIAFNGRTSVEFAARCHLIVTVGLVAVGLAVIGRRAPAEMRSILGVGSLAGLGLVAVCLTDPEPFTRPGSLVNPATAIALAAAAILFLLRAAGTERTRQAATAGFWLLGGLVLAGAALLQAAPSLLGPGGKVTVGPLGLMAVGTLAIYWHGRYRAGELAVGRPALQTMAVAISLLVVAGGLDRIGGLAEYAEEACEFIGAVLLLGAAVPFRSTPIRPIVWTPLRQAGAAALVLAVLILVVGSPLAVRETLAIAL